MTDKTGITMLKGYKYSVGPSTPPPPTICITANDYRPLLTIHPDGTVTGEIEDASEAARLFVESLRGYLTQPTQSDDEAYDLGKRDGYEKAVQDIDMLTGGDGEYCYSTIEGERHCPNVDTMKARIARRLRHPTQSDALREAVIEECAKALEDDAMKCDCAALEERECGCGAWCEWKSITSARAIEIVRALRETGQ